MLCTNCDQPIEPDDGGAILYHPANMSMMCDGDESVDLTRQAEPGVSPANDKRVVFYTNESFFDRETGMYVVARVTEDEAGYEGVRRFTTVAEAQAFADQLNAEKGIDTDTILTVVVSSMRLGNRAWS